MSPFLRAVISRLESERVERLLATPGSALPGAARDTAPDCSGRGGDMRSPRSLAALVEARAARGARIAPLRASGLTWVAIAQRLRLTTRQVRRAGGAP